MLKDRQLVQVRAFRLLQEVMSTTNFLHHGALGADSAEVMRYSLRASMSFRIHNCIEPTPSGHAGALGSHDQNFRLVSVNVVV